MTPVFALLDADDGVGAGCSVSPSLLWLTRLLVLVAISRSMAAWGDRCKAPGRVSLEEATSSKERLLDMIEQKDHACG